MQQHIIDVTRGSAQRAEPVHIKDWKEVANRLSASKRRKAIALYLRSGWTPWGTRLGDGAGPGSLSLTGRQYIMCCGHVLGAKEAQEWVDAGLLEDGPRDRFDRPTLKLTPAGAVRLNQHGQ